MIAKVDACERGKRLIFLCVYTVKDLILQSFCNFFVSLKESFRKRNSLKYIFSIHPGRKSVILDHKNLCVADTKI